MDQSYRVGGAWRGGERSAQEAWRPFLRSVAALAAAGVLGLAVTAYVALRTSQGLRLDRAAYDAVTSPPLVLDRLYEGLDLVSVGSVAASLLVCVALAILRRRLDLALGALVVIGVRTCRRSFSRITCSPVSTLFMDRTACRADTRRWRCR